VFLDVADAVGRAGDGQRQAARQCVGLGVLGAGAAAAAGLADWQHTMDDARRVGLVHGTLNLAATGLMAGSWVRRGRGDHRGGRGLGLAGYVVAATRAWLGGSLVSRLGVGVDNADRRLAPRGFTDVCADADVAERTLHRVEVDGRSVLLTRLHGQVHAYGSRCPHLGGPLERGWVRDDCVVCPCHGSNFSLVDGAVRTGPATHGLPPLDVRVRNGRVEVRCRPPVSQAPPGSVIAREQEQAGARD
jgi:nitrite reductase/ring-hydroxylating ferredoxin subunit